MSYEELVNVEGTWYIDPPYQKQGIYYKHSSKGINYDELSKWCLSRKGEIIVCENMGATWLDFKPLVDLKGQTHIIQTEAIFYQKIL